MPFAGPDPIAQPSYPAVQLPGMPDFNDQAQNVYAIDWGFFDWWLKTPAPRAVLAANGGGAGSVPSGDWLPAEAYGNVPGWVVTAPSEQFSIRQQLLTAIPANRDVVLKVLGNGWDVDKQIWCRRYDEPTFDAGPDRIRFNIPIVCPDPYKYAASAQVGAVGVDAGSSWYETFTDSSGWREPFTGAPWVETYTQTVPPGPYPTQVLLTSAGDASSHRLVITANGPLTSGDWKITQEYSDQGVTKIKTMWVAQTVAAGQQLIIDCYDESATISGEDVSSLIRGDSLTFEPGGNTYRLTSATANTIAYAGVEAYAAYQ